MEEVQSTYNYTYGNSSWKDQLTSYRGTAITYDSLGNPLSYYNGSSYTLTWEQGRKLASAQKGGTTFEFTYDESGHRISKSGYGETITYVWSGDLLIAEYREYYDTTIYLYDANGSPVGFMYKDFPGYYTGGEFVTFYYEKNLQGDIVGILDSDGNKFVSYSYDAWGNLLKMEYYGEIWSLHANMAEQNPFRYRGYYYDTETGFYFLKSRYYDPKIGRFINVDDPGVLTATPMALTDKNLYAYCDNNPITRVDDDGEFWLTCVAVGFIVGISVQYIGDVVGNVIAGKSGKDIFKATSSFSEYIAAGVGGAIAAIPGGGLIGTMVAGAAGNVVGEFIRGNITSVGDLCKSAFVGAMLNGIGYGAGKVLAKAKVNQINNMSRSTRKAYLRDVFYKNKNKFVNSNLKVFQTNSLQQVENRFWTLSTGFLQQQPQHQ